MTIMNKNFTITMKANRVVSFIVNELNHIVIAVDNNTMTLIDISPNIANLACTQMKKYQVDSSLIERSRLFIDTVFSRISNTDGIGYGLSEDFVASLYEYDENTIQKGIDAINWIDSVIDNSTMAVSSTTDLSWIINKNIVAD